jgi:hypothetical protein
MPLSSNAIKGKGIRHAVSTTRSGTYPSDPSYRRCIYFVRLRGSRNQLVCLATDVHWTKDAVRREINMTNARPFGRRANEIFARELSNVGMSSEAIM